MVLLQSAFRRRSQPRVNECDRIVDCLRRRKYFRVRDDACKSDHDDFKQHQSLKPSRALAYIERLASSECLGFPLQESAARRRFLFALHDFATLFSLPIYFLVIQFGISDADRLVLGKIPNVRDVTSDAVE